MAEKLENIKDALEDADALKDDRAQALIVAFAQGLAAGAKYAAGAKTEEKSEDNK